MKFQCPGCQTTFSVPDEKIPEGKGLRILCPKCRIPVERIEEGQEAASPAEKGESSASAMSSDFEEASDDGSIFEVVEEGVKTALLCSPKTFIEEKLRDTLQELDFHVSVAATMKVVFSKLHHNRYDMIVLDEAMGGATASENLVLHHIQLLPMHVRRQFFLCLVSETMPTPDLFLAFSLGVDMILNIRDLEKAKLILLRAMKDHRTFYRVFNEEIVRKGQF